MKLITFGSDARLGIVEDGRVVASSELGDGVPRTMAELLADWPAGLEKIRNGWPKGGSQAGSGVAFESVELRAPVPRPGKILAAGVNYQSHGEEQNRDAPDHPVLFAKMPTAVVGSGSAIRWSPSLTQGVDFEAELAVVIGRTLPARDARRMRSTTSPATPA